MATELSFEKQLKALEQKIQELKAFMKESGIDLTQEITALEEKQKELRTALYENLSPWQKVQIARHMGRPTTLEIAEAILTDFMEFHGDRVYGDDPAMVGGIGFFEGMPVTLIGHQKGRDTKENIARNFGMPHPEGYRKALRLMRQAEKFGRPVITLVNTPGAYPGKAAEERGQSMAIAENLKAMAALTVPIVVVIVGEGASGGALGIGVGNRVLMLEHAWYSVISPEGAAALLWKDASLAEKAAREMRITAQDLLALGVIDEVIPEPLGGAHQDKPAAIQTIKEAIFRHLQDLMKLSAEELVIDRYEKFRRMGAVVSFLELDQS
ncbi:MAG: acetyl-CoA carboxylase carboxyltransferase subunit alpha [Candidatus Carbobacillus altaicus]|nr:acetyl-CoA carboxylase carboxyltransferase subunit alpha [Candidatus Carbobacillus altaicus]